MNDKPFDLDDAIVVTTAELQLKHPVSGAPLGIFVTIAGPEHDARRQRLFAVMRQKRAEIEKTGKMLAGDPADEQDDLIDTLVICTLGWKGVRAGGAEIAFSADACRALYADPKRAWVRDQVKAGLDANELFIGASACA